jgi:hypothetical protein
MPYQVSVFAENRPGKIERITGVLAKKNINIRAITISDSGDYGIIKLLLDRPEEGCEAIKEEGIAATLREIIAVRMDDKPGGLNIISSALSKHGVNVEDAYGFVIKSRESAIFIFQVDNVKRVEKILDEAGIATLSEKELYLL